MYCPKCGRDPLSISYDEILQLYECSCGKQWRKLVEENTPSEEENSGVGIKQSINNNFSGPAKRVEKGR